jgi:hypothetical protein
VLNIFSIAVALLLTALLAIFSGALLYNWYTSKGTAKDCGCSGNDPLSYKAALTRNALLIVVLFGIITVSSFADITTSLLLSAAEVVILFGLVARAVAVQTKFAGQVITAFESLRNEKRLNRRTFLRTASLASLGLLTATMFGRLPIASADSTGDGCTCNVPTFRGVWANPNCSCCNSCATSCIGQQLFFRVYVCAQNHGIDCDIIPEPHAVTCICRNL